MRVTTRPEQDVVGSIPFQDRRSTVYPSDSAGVTDLCSVKSTTVCFFYVSQFHVQNECFTQYAGVTVFNVNNNFQFPNLEMITIILNYIP